MAYFHVYNDPHDDNGPNLAKFIFACIFFNAIGAWPLVIVMILYELAKAWERRQSAKPRKAAPAQYATPDEQAAAQAESTSQSQLAARKLRRQLSTVFLVAGVVIAAFAIPHLFTVVDDLMYGLFDSYTLRYDLLPGLYSLLGGGALGWLGSRMKRTLRLEKLFANITGDADHITIRELSDASGYKKAETMELVKSAINHGMFGPNAFIDMRTDTLVVRGPAPEPVKRPRKKAQPKTEPAGQNSYRAILQQLRDVNDAIPGEEMSSKIDQLEDISTRIFTLAEKDPDKKPQLSKFMDYYLPTALKLLDTYATLEQQGMSGQNVTETKASIENAMDMLIQAFAGQLDKLFQTDALDVSSDIAALQSLLAMDGLPPDGLFGTPHSAPDPASHT